MQDESLETLIETVIDRLQQKTNRLQIVGRALTAEELERIELFGKTIGNLTEVLNLSAAEMA